MKIFYWLIICIILCTVQCSQQMSIQGRPDVLVKKYFKDDSTYVIVCKGYPKPGTLGIQATQTAKEAALLNAQFLARETFSEDVDVIKNGLVDGFTVHDNYVIITYIIKYPQLKKYLITK